MAQTRTVKTYEGLFESQAQDRFRAEATEAAPHGWHPVDEHWNGQVLTVTYEHRPGPAAVAASAQAGVTEDGPSTPTRTARGWAKVTLGALASMMALVLVTLVGASVYKPSPSTAPVNKGPSTIRVSAADYGSVWPLKV